MLFFNSAEEVPVGNAQVKQYWAKVEDGVVTQVIVADPSFVEGLEGTWVQTYKDGSNRGNYAGRGYTYQSDVDLFMPPKPFDSWVLATDTAKWIAPVEMPRKRLRDDEAYRWNETTKDWELEVIDTRDPLIRFNESL